MTTEAFAARTKGLSRSDEIVAVENALRAYYAVDAAQFAARLAVTNSLLTKIDTYLAGSTTHQAAVNDLRIDVVLARNAYTGAVAAAGRAAGAEVAAIGDLVEAHDKAAQMGMRDEDDNDAARIKTAITAEGNQLVGRMTGAQKDEAVRADVLALSVIASEPGTHVTTRIILEQLVNRADITIFDVFTPGTTLTPPPAARKYTLKNALFPPMGKQERLGAFVHELTHVDAGEAYGNTALLLLCSPGLLGNGPKLKELAACRVAAIADLRALLTADKQLTAAQRSLFASKLQYVQEQATVGVYAERYYSFGKIDAATRDRLVGVDALIANSGVLVEFDTVINQLLVYLQMWKISTTTPLHARVLAIAEQQQQQRWQG
ncbi:hypothetical protein ACN28G_05775 [Micromonospora sp. WMMA1923]